jgi:hypothetical protein
MMMIGINKTGPSTDHDCSSDEELESSPDPTMLGTPNTVQSLVHRLMMLMSPRGPEMDPLEDKNLVCAVRISHCSLMIQYEIMSACRAKRSPRFKIFVTYI